MQANAKITLVRFQSMGNVATLCDVCSKLASRTCKLCGKRVCDAHYDAKLGICTPCRSGKSNEIKR